MSLADQHVQGKDMGVKLPIAPVEGRNFDDSKLMEYPRHTHIPADFPQDDFDQYPNDFIPGITSRDDHPSLEEDAYILQPK